MRITALVVLGCISNLAIGQSPQSIVERGISAHGGAEALAKCKFMEQVAKGTIQTQNEGAEATREGKLALPDRALWVINIRIGGQFRRTTLGLNGLSGWIQSGSNPATDMTTFAYDEIAEEAYVHWLCTVASLAGRDLKLTSAPVAAVANRPADAILVAKPGKPQVTLCFDKGTGLLVSARYRGREGNKEFLLENHKEFAGLKLPTKLTDLKENNKQAEWEVTEYKFVPKLELATFKKP